MASPKELRRLSKINSFDWRTALTPTFETIAVFSRLANRPRGPAAT